MQRHLFVYGTLMTTADGAGLGRSMRARLQREADILGAASMAGRLYDLGRYPGLVASGDGDRVQGEVVRLADPADAFTWLDAYENVGRDDQAGEYERVVRWARLVSGGEIEAWVYLYRGDLTHARHVTDGRWRP